MEDRTNVGRGKKSNELGSRKSLCLKETSNHACTLTRYNDVNRLGRKRNCLSILFFSPFNHSRNICTYSHRKYWSRESCMPGWFNGIVETNPREEPRYNGEMISQSMYRRWSEIKVLSPLEYIACSLANFKMSSRHSTPPRDPANTVIVLPLHNNICPSAEPISPMISSPVKLGSRSQPRAKSETCPYRGYSANNRTVTDGTRYTKHFHGPSFTFAAPTTRSCRSSLAGHSSRRGFQFRSRFEPARTQRLPGRRADEERMAVESIEPRESKAKEGERGLVSRINDLDGVLYGSDGLLVRCINPPTDIMQS